MEGGHQENRGRRRERKGKNWEVQEGGTWEKMQNTNIGFVKFETKQLFTNFVFGLVSLSL